MFVNKIHEILWGDDINSLVCIFISTVQKCFVENYGNQCFVENYEILKFRIFLIFHPIYMFEFNYSSIDSTHYVNVSRLSRTVGILNGFPSWRLQWLTVLSMLVIRWITAGICHFLSCYVTLFWLRVEFDKFPSFECEDSPNDDSTLKHNCNVKFNLDVKCDHGTI